MAIACYAGCSGFGRRVIHGCMVRTYGCGAIGPPGGDAAKDAVYLRSQRAGFIVTAQTLNISPLHMAVYAFVLKTFHNLGMNLEPVWVSAIIMQDLVVMTVPAGITREVGGWILGVIVSRGCFSAMTGGAPLWQADLGLDTIDAAEVVDIIYRLGPVTGDTDDFVICRSPPCRVVTGVAFGI